VSGAKGDSDRVRITDVAPRDGLQNEPKPIPTERKAKLVGSLARSGVDEVEITSFVSRKWIPQLGDAEELCGLVATGKPSDVVYSALVPNAKGMERLLAMNEAHAGVIDKMSVFTAASETFAQKNTNAAIAETLERFRPVFEMAKSNRLPVRGYISCVVACPFEGPIAPAAVADVVSRLAEAGADEIDLGDTIGAGTPETIEAMLRAAFERIEAERITLHLHDTFGRAAECIRTALAMGVRSFDASAGGLGGCPYASTPDRRAPGNVSTSVLLDTVEAAGLSHGVDRRKLAEATEAAIAATGGAA